MTLNGARVALSEALQSITDLRCHPTFPQRLDPPACFVGAMTRDPAQEFAGGSTVSFEVFVCVSPVELARQVHVLDGFADATGDTSVEAAINADPTLSGAVSSAVVTQVQSPVQVEVAGLPLLAAQFTVEVFL